MAKEVATGLHHLIGNSPFHRRPDAETHPFSRPAAIKWRQMVKAFRHLISRNFQAISTDKGLNGKMDKVANNPSLGAYTRTSVTFYPAVSS